MKKHFIIIAVFIVSICGCNKATEDFLKTNNVVSFSALAPGADTKTTIHEQWSEEDGYTYSMSWTGNETFYIQSCPASFPPEDETNTSRRSTTRYSFTNSAKGAKATFTPDEAGYPVSFVAGDQYYINSSPNIGTWQTSCTMNRTDVHSSAPTSYYIIQQIPWIQTYNPENELGLSDNSIPLYGFICKGKGRGYEPEDVQLRANGAIIKFVLKNTTEKPKTIEYITLTSAQGGLAGNLLMYMDGNLTMTNNTFTYGAGEKRNEIRLNCNNAVINSGEEKVFSFVIAGSVYAVARGVTEDEVLIKPGLEWKVYAPGNDTPIATAQYTDFWKYLYGGKVYTKKGSI